MKIYFKTKKKINRMISGRIELKHDLWEALRAFLLLGPTLKTGSLHQHWNKEETSQWHQVAAELHTGIKEQKLVVLFVLLFIL